MHDPAPTLAHAVLGAFAHQRRRCSSAHTLLLVVGDAEDAACRRSPCNMCRTEPNALSASIFPGSACQAPSGSQIQIAQMAAR